MWNVSSEIWNLPQQQIVVEDILVRFLQLQLFFFYGTLVQQSTSFSRQLFSSGFSSFVVLSLSNLRDSPLELCFCRFQVVFPAFSTPHRPAAQVPPPLNSVATPAPPPACMSSWKTEKPLGLLLCWFKLCYFVVDSNAIPASVNMSPFDKIPQPRTKPRPREKCSDSCPH